MVSEESAKEEVGCGGNEDVEMATWSHNDGKKKEIRVRGTKWEKYQQSARKMVKTVQTCNEKR